MIEPTADTTATELIKHNAGRTTVRYARSRNDDAIAMYDNGQWQILVAKLVTGQWAPAYPVRANGADPWAPWVEVTERLTPPAESV